MMILFVFFPLKMVNVTPEYVAEIIDKFELSDENKQRGIMGIEGKFLPFHHSNLYILQQSFMSLFSLPLDFFPPTFVFILR